MKRSLPLMAVQRSRDMRSRRLLYILAVVPYVPLLLFILYFTVLQSDSPGYNVKARGVDCKTSIDVSRISSDRSLLQTKDGLRPKPLDWVDGHILQLSEHPDIDIRGKFQRERISKMCKKHSLTEEQRLLVKQDTITEFHSHHLIFDDNKKIIFCYVPKVGCTNMKRLMLYMSDNLPQYTVDWPWVDHSKYIVPAIKHASFLNQTLTDREKKMRVASYYKFMVVRNPFERLVSAYRNKLEEPLLFGFEDRFPEKVKVEILNRYRPTQLSHWRRTVPTKPFNISVTFSEFCRYITETNSSEMNEHFVPSMDICHPCLMEYDFYGNFRNYSTDAGQLIKKFDTNPKFYRDESLHLPEDQTSKKLLRYYRTLTYREKTKLLGVLYDEIMFYYTLYPSQRHSHKELLDIDIPIETL